MTKVLLLAIISHLSLSGFGQLQEATPAEWTSIGKLKFGGITKAKLEYKTNGRDTVYLLFVKDVREHPKDNYFSISFRNIDGTYEKLYEILKSFFSGENKKNKKYSRTFMLGDKAVNIQHHLLITGRGIMFHTEDGYTYWSEKDVDKLFGKN